MHHAFYDGAVGQQGEELRAATSGLRVLYAWNKNELYFGKGGPKSQPISRREQDAGRYQSIRSKEGLSLYLVSAPSPLRSTRFSRNPLPLPLAHSSALLLRHHFSVRGRLRPERKADSGEEPSPGGSGGKSLHWLHAASSNRSSRWRAVLALFTSHLPLISAQMHCHGVPEVVYQTAYL